MALLPPDVIARIRKIHITTAHQVDDLMAGDYVSVFKGRGMEFEQVREYVPGDDVRNIDWNVTARSQSAFVKEFREERELTVILVVDVSGSQAFGTTEDFKQDLAARFAAALAFTAIRNNDKVGLILFSDQIELFVPPKKGRGHVWRVIREILTANPRGRGTDIAGALAFLSRVARRRAVVFLISDFLDESFERMLRVGRARHDLIAVSVTDPRELQLTPMGLVELQDAESGKWVMVDTLDPGFLRAYEKTAHARMRTRSDQLKACGVDEIALRTDQDWVKPLVRYFRMRGQRR
ncbi:MAG: DUF58 domain-containing protein [Myxococcota bacterium]|jgi:uncharacterized protein (DUF58 family)|nr:DUF58 domain-containing protein [Myxococcota bacterium]